MPLAEVSLLSRIISVSILVLIVSRALDHQILTKLVRIPLRVPQTTSASGQSQPGQLSKHIVRLGQINLAVSDIRISPHGTYLSIIADNGVFVRKLGVKSGSDAWVKIAVDIGVTCLRWCPSEAAGSIVKRGDEEWFATGDKGGFVRLYRGGLIQAYRTLQQQNAASSAPKSTDAWYKIGSSGSEVTLASTALHWHSHPVHALCFTTHGSQLLSGGEENVLVTWHLDTLKNSFMARLSVGATSFEWIGVKPMGHVEGAEEEYWSGFVDGSIVKVGAATNKALPVGKRARINKLDRDLQLGKRYPLAYHPPTRSMVLASSHPSTLQFFQPSTSSLVFDLEVVPSNRVSRADKEITPIKVSSVVFSPATASSEAGQWMATYETRPADTEQGGGKVTAVKLWFWATGKNGYVLNTQLDRVHGFHDVTSMSFAPAPLSGSNPDTRRGAGWLFMTTGSDGTAKVWTVKRGLAEVGQKGPGEFRLDVVIPAPFQNSLASTLATPLDDQQSHKTLIFSLNLFGGLWTICSAILIGVAEALDRCHLSCSSSMMADSRLYFPRRLGKKQAALEEG
jgi:NET1-associated nuclear protein 1 (U3 small nucleolar RNA-associated protein 17)